MKTTRVPALCRRVPENKSLGVRCLANYLLRELWASEQVEESLAGSDVADIADPGRIRPGGSEPLCSGLFRTLLDEATYFTEKASELTQVVAHPRHHFGTPLQTSQAPGDRRRTA